MKKRRKKQCHAKGGLIAWPGRMDINDYEMSIRKTTKKSAKCPFSGGTGMSCLKCAHLDRSRKSQVGKCYRYGCTASMDGYISTWINGDNLLDTISCDVDRKGGQEYQTSIFDFIEQRGWGHE